MSEKPRILDVVSKGVAMRQIFNRWRDGEPEIEEDNETAELRQTFKLFDQDQSGSISADELERATQSLGMNLKREELLKIIDEVDENHDGTIDFDEFCVFIKRASKKKTTWDDIIRQCLEVFNPDRTGVNEAAFQKVLRQIGGIKDERLMEQIFAEFDIDGNGLLDYHEFANMVKFYMTDEDAGI